MESSLPPIFTDIASITGIVGFFITIWVLVETKSIKSKFKNKARIPEIHKELSDCASRISSAMDDWANTQDIIRKEFYDCIAYTESLNEKLSRQNKQKTLDLLDKLAPKNGWLKKRKKAQIENVKVAWDLYQELSIMNTRIKQILNDMKWD